MSSHVRLLFGDQLGPHFLDDHDGPVLLVESLRAFARAPLHRQKAHLLLSALRHRAAELGDRAHHVRAERFDSAIETLDPRPEVIDPTSFRARRLVRALDCSILPSRGFITSESEFAKWADGRGSRRLLMEDWYRRVRVSTGLLMEGDEPAGGRWNFDADNRQPPPRDRKELGIPAPWTPREDEIDEQVRRDLDRWASEGRVQFVGQDGPRLFAATRSEAVAALTWFIEQRLHTFGPYEDAMLESDWSMSHSLLSVPLNLGLLHPYEVASAAEGAFRSGHIPIASAEGMVRQVAGWREYVWHLYWRLGEGYGQESNHLNAMQPLPDWFGKLQHKAVQARCLSSALRDVDERGWNHHIVRLMVLGNWALQRGYDPQQMLEWFRTRFVDGYDWVMAANVIGMALYADGGVMATKPYAAGGAYIRRMSDHCGDCHYRPDRRLGDDACPFTAGYWSFLDRNQSVLRGNHRMAQPLAGLRRIADIAAVVDQEAARGDCEP